MTIAYSVNGGSQIYGVQSDWQRQVKSRDTDGTSVYQNYALNTWTVANMTMANYLTLQALSGAILTSLETNDIDDRDAAATYNSGVEVVNAVTAQHVGVQAQGVTVQFRVKVA